MTRWRIVGAGALLSLPLLILAAFAVWFWFAEVPKFVSRERSRVTREYRERAVELAANTNATVVSRGKGWRQTGKIAGVPWGYLEDGGRIRIWYGADASVRSAIAEVEETTDVESLFGAFIVAALSSVFLLTALGFRSFVRLERDRNDFVAAAAHDLETPVAALGMVLENRAAGIATDAEAFDECERLAVRLGRLVDNLRDFIHRGRRGAPVPIDFDIVASVREAYRPFAADYRDLLGADVPIGVTGSEKGEPPSSAAADVAQDASPSVRIHADETLTEQILWNLFANDLKYAAPYGPVSVSVTCDASRVRIAFVDEGRGLAPREMKRIFERYYRAKSVMSSGKGGFGIGLCSAREFARAMGGDLTVRANAPKGCVFTLELPKERQDHHA